MLRVTVWFSASIHEDPVTYNIARIPCVGEKLSLISTDQATGQRFKNFVVRNVIFNCYTKKTDEMNPDDSVTPECEIEVEEIEDAFELNR